MAPLVTWELEPAWDHAYLIAGYQLHPPRFVTDHVEIDVEYTLTGVITAGGAQEAESIERVTFVLVGDDESGWRIAAPPPPLHLFSSAVDVAALQATLTPHSPSYLSASVFVWRMFNEAGWPMPYRPLKALRDPEVFSAVAEPKPGDLALFLAENVPYHAGIVTADGEIVSATVNAGLMRTTTEAFSGTVLFLRLRESARSAAVAPTARVAEEGGAVATSTPRPRLGPASPKPKKVGRATPAVKASRRRSPRAKAATGKSARRHATPPPRPR